MLALLPLLTAPALAACPDVAERAAAARAAYDAVEMDVARAALAEGLAALSCQTRVLQPAELLALYHTSALVALTLDDREGLTYATLRAVAADHVGGRPHDAFGPELQAQFDTWAARLGGSLVNIRVDGGGTVWVDGRIADAMRPLPVAQGEHVVQIDAGDGSPVRTAVQEVSSETMVATGVPIFAPPGEAAVPLPDLDAVPPPLPRPAPAPSSSAHRRRPAVVWLASAAAAGGATFLLSSAWLSEGKFAASRYAAATFGGCGTTDTCYDTARADAIRSDSARINLAYAGGYGLSAVSGGLLVLGAVGLPARSSD